MGLPQPVKRYTPQEYYELERAATYKSDYYDGEIFATPGDLRPRHPQSGGHSLIAANIVGELRHRLIKGKPCRAYESNLRVKIKATGLRTYPDAAVYCGPLQRDEEDRSGETVTNPTILFEVLSRSTEGYDRGLKSESYRRIESLKAYVLVAQDSAHVEIYERQANGAWLLREERGLGAALAIPAIGIELPLAEVYDGVDFTAPEEPPQNV